ncbi:MAG: desulfoferrodoxin FeS4 iron-binding domain-containing protein [Helicobacteraceae bacterium]|jgi:desulfoferrodoxin-like iron-binding protein|nr:desulfoferrodoxin FeS4 iron-binding domain-containing protein [Helicobacteraceae bacterium]
MKQYQIYHCAKCGNEVEVQKAGGGTLACCGEAMQVVNENVTPTNLLKAFAGESQARNKYNFFAEVARGEGFNQIADFFDEFALNEYSHAKMEFALYNKIARGNDWDKTAANLLCAADGEKYEHTTMYPNFAAIAKEEGFDEAARLFGAIGKVEIEHEQKYLALEKKLTELGFFSGERDEIWICDVCGHTHRGKKAPGACLVCKASQAHFRQAGL